MDLKLLRSFPITSREESRQRHLKYYFTGDTCKHGHRSPRYASTSACVECLKNGHAARNSPKSRELVSYAPHRLWVNKRMTAMHWETLEVYLQACADQFTESIQAQLRPWCDGCNGFGVVATGKECPKCHRGGVCLE